MYRVECITVAYAAHIGVGNLEGLAHSSLLFPVSRKGPNFGGSYGIIIVLLW